MKKEKKELTLDEKVDLILKFQRSMRMWAILRAVTSFAFFLVFIILPIVGLIYIAQWIKETTGIDFSGDMSAMMNSLGALQGLGGAEGGTSIVNVDEISKGVEEVLRNMGLDQTK